MCKYYRWGYTSATCKSDGNNWISGSKETEAYCRSQDNCVLKLKNQDINDKIKIGEKIEKLKSIKHTRIKS